MIADLRNSRDISSYIAPLAFGIHLTLSMPKADLWASQFDIKASVLFLIAGSIGSRDSGYRSPWCFEHHARSRRAGPTLVGPEVIRELQRNECRIINSDDPCIPDGSARAPLTAPTSPLLPPPTAWPFPAALFSSFYVGRSVARRSYRAAGTILNQKVN
jgi:hypothetical protein